MYVFTAAQKILLLTSARMRREGYRIKDLVQAIRGKDLALQLQTASNAKHLCKIADTVGWKKLWDHALDHGEACITSLRNLVRVVSYPKHAISSCPLCEVSELDVPLPGHIIEKHTNST